MKLIAIFTALAATTTLANPLHTLTSRNVDPSLVPAYGVTAGQNPTGTGDCQGANGTLIPCNCPPDRTLFLQDLNANVNAGHAVNYTSATVSWPTGSSCADQSTRLNACLVTLQNLYGAGVGCPAASAPNFVGPPPGC